MKKLLILFLFVLLPLTACLRDSAYDVSCVVPAAQCKGQERRYSGDPCGKDNEHAAILKRAAQTCQTIMTPHCGSKIVCSCTIKAVRPRSCSVYK